MMLLSDAIEGLKSLGDKSVDLIVTDPAYSSIEEARAQGTTTRLKNSKSSSNEWFPVVEDDYYTEFFAQCYRVLKRHTHLYVFCDAETYVQIRPDVLGSGFGKRKPLIFYKQTRPMETVCPCCGKELCCRACGKKTLVTRAATSMGYPYRSTYEMILFATKGKRKPPEQEEVVRDVLEARWIKNPNAYPTEKPVELIEILIQQSSFPGDLVVDPFAGSGSTLVAALNQDRRALGFDIYPNALDRWDKRHTPEPDPIGDLFG